MPARARRDTLAVLRSWQARQMGTEAAVTRLRNRAGGLARHNRSTA